MMDKNVSRGAALVSATWVFALAVFLVIAVAIAAVQMNQASTLEQQLADLRKNEAQALEGRQKAEKNLLDLTQIVGYGDPEKPTASSSTTAIQQNIEATKTQFTDMGADVKNLQTVLSRVVETAGQRSRDLAEKESQRQQLANEASEARSTTDRVSKEKQATIDDLRKQMQDATDRFASERSSMEQRIAALQEEGQQMEAKLRDAQAEFEKKESDSRKKVALLNARIQEFQKKLAFTKDPLRTDGHVLSMNEKLDLGFIDLGAKNKLRRGMRFEVLNADPSAPEAKKGMIEVTEVHPEFAEFRIVELKDRFIPLTGGDLISNPIYDPHAERRAVLVGRFSSRYNRDQLTALLAELGIQVQTQVDITTDYLILGSEEIVNGEPVSFNQNTDFKKAETLGVVIVPLKEIESFFNN